MSTNMKLMEELKWLISSPTSKELKDRIDLIEETNQKDIDRYIYVARNDKGDIVSHSFFATSKINAKIEADNFRNIYSDAKIEVCRIPSELSKNIQFQNLLQKDCFDDSVQEQLNSYINTKDKEVIYSLDNNNDNANKILYNDKHKDYTLSKIGENTYSIKLAEKTYCLNTSLELDKLSKDNMREFLKGKPVNYNVGGTTIDSPLSIIQLEITDTNNARCSYKVPLLENKGKIIYSEVNVENGKRIMSNFALYDKTTCKSYVMDMQKYEMTKENMGKLRDIFNENNNNICKSKDLDSATHKPSVNKEALIKLGKGAVKGTIALAKQADGVAGIG